VLHQTGCPSFLSILLTAAVVRSACAVYIGVHSFTHMYLHRHTGLCIQVTYTTYSPVLLTGIRPPSYHSIHVNFPVSPFLPFITVIVLPISCICTVHICSPPLHSSIRPRPMKAAALHALNDNQVVVHMVWHHNTPLYVP
jgi:hypothetical protein